MSKRDWTDYALGVGYVGLGLGLLGKAVGAVNGTAGTPLIPASGAGATGAAGAPEEDAQLEAAGQGVKGLGRAHPPRSLDPGLPPDHAAAYAITGRRPAGGGGAAPGEEALVDPDKFIDLIAADRGKALAKKPAELESGVARMDLGPIGERVGIILSMIAFYGEQPIWQRLASANLSRRCRPATGADGGWCTREQDYDGEAKVLFDFVRRNVRYQRDPATRDTFSTPDRSLGMRSGDCDCVVILLGSLLRASGTYYVRARVIQERGAQDWSHIYLIACPTNKPKQDGWIAMDPSQNKPMGWQAEGADECARTGRPAGIVARVRDFDVPAHPTDAMAELLLAISAPTAVGTGRGARGRSPSAAGPSPRARAPAAQSPAARAAGIRTPIGGHARPAGNSRRGSRAGKD